MGKRIKSIIFLLILGTICSSLLLGLRTYTRARIEEYQEWKFKTTILKSAGIDFNNSNWDKIFREKIERRQKGNLIYYITPDNHYMFEFEGRGLWGKIKGIITLSADLSTIETLDIISQEETPGLGGRITEESFLESFKGKRILPKLVLALRKKATKNNEVDAITGASMTSEALIRMINQAVINFRRQTQ